MVGILAGVDSTFECCPIVRTLNAFFRFFQEVESSESRDDDSGDENDEDADDVSVPWHHEQLYRLYGKEVADEFLYPRVQDAQRSVTSLRVKRVTRRNGGEHCSL